MRSITYLWDYCSLHIPQLQSNGRCKRYVSIKSPAHVFNEIIEPNAVDFHGNKHLAEEAKTPPRTFSSNNTFIKSSSLREPLPNILLQEPANPARSNLDKKSIQTVRISRSDVIIPDKKDRYSSVCG